MADIAYLTLLYEDFQMLQIIDPDKFDKNYADIKNKVNEMIDVLNVDVTSLSTHKTSSDHDGRYYTETEINSFLALKSNDNVVVKLSENQSIDGIKTFTSSPIIPTPTSNTQASTKKYVDDVATGVVLGQIPDNSLTNNKLSSDIKIGSLASLNTTDKSSVVFAINEVDSKLHDVESSLDDGIQIQTPLSFGSNTITKTGAETTPLNTTFTPKHYVNLLGNDGNCEDVSKWRTFASNLSADTANKVFGSQSVKAIGTAINTAILLYRDQPFYLTKDKYYMASAYVKTGVPIGAIFLVGVSANNDADGGSTTVTQNTAHTRVAFKFMATRDSSTPLYVSSIGKENPTAVSDVSMDGVMITEITATEYTNDSVDTLMARYPYADSLAVTKNLYLKSYHADGSSEECVIEGDFFTGDTLELKDGQVIGSKQWKLRTLLGEDYAISFYGGYTGYKGILIYGDNLKGKASGYTKDQFIGIKYNGDVLKSAADVNYTEQILLYDIGANNGKAILTVSDSDTGFSESINPNDDEVKAFMNGWKATTNNGTRYTKWVSAVDGTTAPTTQTIDFVKSNIAPNYEGYKLAYKLSTAQQINEGSDSYLAPIKGSVPVLKQGVNTVVLKDGVALNEVVVPYISDVMAHINDVRDSFSSARLRNKVKVITAIKKNGVDDTSNWTIDPNLTYTYGLQRAYTTIYDISATYTVDYEILDEIAPQIGTAEASYSEGLVDSVNGLYGIAETKQNQDVSLDNYISLAMYEKTISNSRLMSMWYVNGATLYVRSVIGVVKKLSKTPILNQDTLNIYKGDGVTDVTSLFVLDGRVYNDNQVIVTYRTTDATTITNIKANGVIVNGSITVDCRGVI